LIISSDLGICNK